MTVLALGAAAVLTAFALALAIVDRALGFGPAPLALARVVLREALRVRFLAVLLAGLLLLVPLLPNLLSPQQPLVDRARLVIQYGLGAAWILASLVTIVSVCWSVGEDLRAQRIALVLTKPVSRAQYLLGAWIGAVGLQAVILGVLGGCVYALVAVHLPTLAPASGEAPGALDAEVLVARRAVPFGPPQGVRDAIRADALRAAADHAQHEPERALAAGGERAWAEEEALRRLAGYHSVGPASRRVFYASGVGPVAADLGALSVRFTARVPGDEPDARRIPLVVTIDPGGPAEVHHTLVVQSFVPHTLAVDAAALDTSGGLTIAVTQGSDGTIALEPGPDLEVWVPVGGFGANLARGLAAMWFRQWVLAALAVCFASLVSFPVAVVASGVGLFALTAGSVVRAGIERAEAGAVASVLYALTWPLERFAALGPIEPIVLGHAIAWSHVVEALVVFGLVGSALLGAAGVFAFGRRELANQEGPL